MYIDYEYYKSLYGEKAIPEEDFIRLLWDAEREVNKATSGVDSVKKLKVAFPTYEEDAEAVKRCISDLVNKLYELEEKERNINLLSQYIKREDGSFQGKIVSSVSAGNENISYAVGKSSETILKSTIEKELEIYNFITSKLSGVSDANGVNLLFAGRYPYYVRNT